MQSLLRLEPGNFDDIMAVLKQAAKPLIDNPPMKTDALGRRTIDEEAFKAELAKVLDDAEQVIVDVSKAGPGGRSRFDGAVRDAIFSTLYGPDGKRNDKTVADMPSISELRFNKVMDNVITHKPREVTKDEFAALVRTLINECGEDPDMLDAIEYSARCFLVTGDAHVRSPEVIAKRVAAYKANMRELMSVAGENRVMLDAAHLLAKRFSGLVLPEGTYTKVMVAVKAVDLTPFKGLDADSDFMDIHNAVLALNKAVRDILSKSGALDKLDGQDEVAPIRRFLQDVLVSRLSKADLRGISTALSTPMAAKLDQLYLACGSDSGKLPKDLSKGLKKEIVTQFNTLASYMDEFKEVVEKALGRETFTPIDLKAAKLVKKEDFYAGDVLDSVKKDSAEFVELKRDEFLNSVVTGKSEVAQAIRGLFADMIGPTPNDPSNEAYGKISEKTNRMMNASVMTEAKKVMQGDIRNTMFAKDLYRGVDVTLDGVGKLSTDLNTALDQIAHFVTGNADAKFDTLDVALKKKAAIVIGTIG